MNIYNTINNSSNERPVPRQTARREGVPLPLIVEELQRKVERLEVSKL